MGEQVFFFGFVRRSLLLARIFLPVRLMWLAYSQEGWRVVWVSGETRCPWCGEDPLYAKYHDTEWGVPERDGGKLFAKLLLDGAQAGLSWITILRKRDGYYRAFEGFDPHRLARFSDAKLEALMRDPGIVRNRLKIQSARKNAQGYLRIVEREGDFAPYLWSFVGGEPLVNRWRRIEEAPTSSPEAERLSRALKRDGFSFVGPTIVYAFMQAVGMVNDHLVGCFRHGEV